MLNLISTLRPDHYVVVKVDGKRQTVVFGAFLPLTKRAASQFAKTLKGEHRVIMRKTAKRERLLNFAV